MPHLCKLLSIGCAPVCRRWRPSVLIGCCAVARFAGNRAGSPFHAAGGRIPDGLCARLVPIARPKRACGQPTAFFRPLRFCTSRDYFRKIQLI
jgi:hypothetical protein